MTFLLALLLFGGYLIAGRLLRSSIDVLGKKKAVSEVRARYVAKTLHLGLTGMFIILLMLVFGVEYGQFAVFFSSVFAVIGVALFAQWSILSNITASLIIFFGFPYRVGDKVKVADKDEDVSGRIMEISTFHVILKRDNGDTVTYPNSLILQKAVIKLADHSHPHEADVKVESDSHGSA